MSSREHVILNHVDSPLKILFWTKGEISQHLAAGDFAKGRKAVADAVSYVAKKNPVAAPVVKQAAPQKAAVTA